MYNVNQKLSVGLDINLDTIQAIRLMMAILESDFLIHFSEGYENILIHLSKYFYFDYQIGLNNVPALPKIVIDHRTPMCKFGNIERPLIFPHGIFSLCKSKWQPYRENIYYFSGLMTKKRLVVFRDWIVKNSDRSRIRVFLDFFLITLINKQVERRSESKGIGSSRNYSLWIHNQAKAKIVLSTLGRWFPVKVWDDEYYNQMANSKFVLCPNGDFIWTYRFFEAIICGAIPIIEDEADIYKGFIYYKMSDPSTNYIYDKDIVLHNYNLAKETLTLSKNIINHEIDVLLA